MLQPKDRHKTYTFVLVALGSNVKSHAGTPVETLIAAIEALSTSELEVERISRIFTTPAVPKGSGPDFANAVLSAKTTLPAPEVLGLLHRIEAQFSRERPQRWGPRTLDLDLLAFGQDVHPDAGTFAHWAQLSPDTQHSVAPDTLIVPHPRLHERGFVLLPMMDIAPTWCHPVLGKTTQQMVQDLPPDALDGIEPADRP